MLKRRKLLVFSVSLAALLVATLASAALVAIDPVKVLLTGDNPSKSISLRNNGSERVRFQVSAFTWRQSLRGEMQLTPTPDLVFFPSLLELAPGETRRVRVTTTTQVSSTEQSYRLFADELPPLAAQPGGAIRVLTRFGLPVFLAPDAAKAAPALTLGMNSGRLKITLENRGNAHFIAQSVRIVGRAADGSSLLQQDLPAWYMLAGGKREYDLPIAPDTCAKLSQVSANANTDHGPTRADYQVPSTACVTP
jgi:fimbrial chaperone protein